LIKSKPGSRFLFWRVFFTRTGIRFARKRSSRPIQPSHGIAATGCANV